jgi:hypothetical protein
MTTTDEIQSDFLFARPSFVEGVARMVDFGGSLNTYNTAPTGEEADARAMYEDWEALGADLKAALEQLRSEVNERR